MTISEEKIFSELKELRNMIEKMFTEIHDLHQLIEDQQDAIITPNEASLINETRKALAEDKTDQFVRLGEI